MDLDLKSLNPNLVPAVDTFYKSIKFVVQQSHLWPKA